MSSILIYLYFFYLIFSMKKDLLVPMHFHGVSTVREADTYRGMGGVGRVFFTIFHYYFFSI